MAAQKSTAITIHVAQSDRLPDNDQWENRFEDPERDFR